MNMKKIKILNQKELEANLIASIKVFIFLKFRSIKGYN